MRHTTNEVKISQMYCIECGKQGISIPRSKGRQREPGHLKTLYCIHCQKETNHCEIRPDKGSYTFLDFYEEFTLGRFVNGQRVPINELQGCGETECDYNRNGRCWNANNSHKCKYKIGSEENE